MVGDLPEVDDWKDLGYTQDTKRPWGRWNHQYRAYDFSVKYLRLARSIPQAHAALVRMPTGTGKTGIMALLANYFLRKESVLIVVPSAYLTKQVGSALNEDFWMALRKRPRNGPNYAACFVPSTIDRILRNYDRPTILICTTNTLADIHLVPDLFNALKSRISTVLVDEGHREPARTWAKAVRDLAKPTVLFSATPYRNDLRMFRIGRGPKFRFSVKFSESVEAGVIRDINFRQPQHAFIHQNGNGSITKRDPRLFAQELLYYYYGQLLRELSPGVPIPRVIVRCESLESIKEVQKELLSYEIKRHGAGVAKRRVLAVHEELAPDEDDNLWREVPDPRSEARDAVFWVHQFKLTEGLDCSDFCVVAYFEPFRNSRSFVQQNGRVLRNPHPGKKSSAYVFSDKSDSLEEEWATYIEFEKSHQDVIGAADIVEAIRESQPKWFYSTGKYRTGAIFNNDLWHDLRLPASARLYKRPRAFSNGDLSKLAHDVSELLAEQDQVEAGFIEKSYQDGTISIAVLHWEIAQSSHLEETGFFDIHLSVTFFFMNDLHIFYQGQISLSGELLSTPLELVGTEHLEALLPTAEATLKQLSLINCDLGDTAIRRRLLGGRDLDSSAMALNDHLHFVSSVVCNDGERHKYVGFRQSRVTERSTKLLTIEQFELWAKDISEKVSGTETRKNRVLRRYARPVRPPSDVFPGHLLLDLAEFRNNYEYYDGHPDPAFEEEFLATACEIQADGTFECKLGATAVTGRVIYQGSRFYIKSRNLNDIFSAKAPRKRKADSFLSDPLIMRVVTKEGLIYSDGRFFSPSRLHGESRVHDLDFVFSVPGLERITKGEKGDKGKIDKNSWQNGSLFHEIDTNRNLFGSCGVSPDILVCDDLASEVGDFVAIDLSAKKLIVLHAKVFEDRGSLSAKEMHEITAQAKKNLGFFDPAEIMPASRAAKWQGDWRTGKVSLPRIRYTLPAYQEGKKIVNLIQELLHSTDVQKEVWLVLGNAFSERQFKELIRSEKISVYSSIQLIYLIHSCLAGVASIGAKLRLLTSAELL